MSRVKVDAILNTSAFEQGAEKITRTVEGIKTVIEAAFVGEAVKELTAKVYETVEAVDQASIRMKLGTDEVQALSIAAREAGTSLETIETALNKISEAKAKALAGDKEALKSLHDLGVTNAQIHATNNATDILGTVASSASHGGEREQVALQGIGLKGAAGDITALGDSVKDLHGKVEELKKSGQIISEDDIDKLIEAKQEFEAIEQQLMVKLAPIITAITEGVLYGITSLEDLFKGLFDTIIKMATDTIDYLNNLKKNAGQNAESLGVGFLKGYFQGGIGGSLVGAFTAPTTAGSALDLAANLGRDETKGLNDAVNNYSKDSSAIDDRIAAFVAARQKERNPNDNNAPIDASKKPMVNKSLYSDELTKSGNLLGASFGQANMVASQLDIQRRSFDRLDKISTTGDKSLDVLNKIYGALTPAGGQSNWTQDWQYS